MKLKKRIVKIVTVMLFFTVSAFSTAANENYGDYSALLVGDEKGNIFKENNAYTVRPIASITKVMTSMLVLDKINNKEMSFDTKVRVSKKAASVPYGIKLVAGREYTVRDLLKATIIRSSNNAAYALAEHVGNGSADVFVGMMNSRARELGLDSLRYCSPHGLPPSYTGSCMDQGNARDLYKLATTAVQYKDYLNISQNATDYMDNGDIKLVSTNKLLGKVIGVDGLKTGYHNAAGSSIILTAQRNGDRTIVVILGSQKAANRNAIGTREIENYYLESRKRPLDTVETVNAKDIGRSSGKNTDSRNAGRNISIDTDRSAEMTGDFKLVDKNVAIGKVRVGNQEFSLYPKDDITVKADPRVKSAPKVKIEMNKRNRGNLSPGQTVGTFTVKYGDNEYIGALVIK